MKDDRGLDRADLDRHITGDFGERQFAAEPIEGPLAGPYTVDTAVTGCSHCGAGKTYDVVFRKGKSDEIAESITYEDYDEACDMADMLNDAYQRGYKSRCGENLITANALRNMATHIEAIYRNEGGDTPTALRQHAADLDRAASVEF